PQAKSKYPMESNGDPSRDWGVGFWGPSPRSWCWASAPHGCISESDLCQPDPPRKRDPLRQPNLFFRETSIALLLRVSRWLSQSSSRGRSSWAPTKELKI